MRWGCLRSSLARPYSARHARYPPSISVSPSRGERPAWSSPCRAASIRRSPPPCWRRRATRWWASRSSSMRPAGRAGAPAPAAPARTSTTPAGSRTGSASATTCSTTRRRFRAAVIDDFADSYLRGETPIPCVRCNERVKFRDLLDLARDLGADALATGHYARRVEGTAGPELHRALDGTRDQSYFLFATHAGTARVPALPPRHAAQGAGAGGGGAPRPRGSPRSPTARTSASCRRGATPASSSGCAPAPPSPAPSSTGKAACWAGTGASSTSPWASGAASALRDRSRSTCWRSMPARGEVVVGPRAALLRDRVRTGPLAWIGTDAPAPGEERAGAGASPLQPPRRAGAGDAGGGRQRPRSRWKSPSPRPRRGRPACSTRASGCWAAAGSAAPARATLSAAASRDTAPAAHVAAA